MKYLLLVLILPTLAFAGGVQSDYDRDANLASITSFHFAAEPSGDLTDKRMRSAIREQFALTESPASSFAIAYTSSTAPKKRIVTHGPAFRRVPDSATIEDAPETTITIDITDGATHQLLWRGRATFAYTLKSADARTKDAVRKLANAFRKDRRSADR